jgi:4-hydroxy-3-methylbut-2-en-1-yl diphosphate reductase
VITDPRAAFAHLGRRYGPNLSRKEDSAMSVTARVIAAHGPGPLAPGTVLVAEELITRGDEVIGCPAGVMVAADLRRRGVRTVGGRLRLDPDRDVADAAAYAVTFPVAGGGASGIGLAGGPVARTVLDSWTSVARPRTVLLASPRSFCAGVERAIEIVERALELYGGPVYVRRQIVHNVHVVSELEARGGVFVDELDAVPEGATVVFSAHGVSPAVREEAARRALRVIDATCPLVTKVHSESRRFAARGDTVILIGHAGHEEVEGTLGEAPERTIVVESAAGVDDIRVPDPSRVSYLTQTTLAVDETSEVVDALRRRFPAIQGPGSDDICYATTNRQRALAAVVEEAELVLVVGSANSSNSLRLVELAERQGTPAHLIDGPGDIRAEWIDGVRVIGLTAGASAPPMLIDAVIDALNGLAGVTVNERETARETMTFGLPLGVRES